jgi:hypothetical protein
MFTIPVTRHGCAWHFIGEQSVMIPHLGAAGFMQKMLNPINPRVTCTNMFGLKHFAKLRASQIVSLLAMVVKGINDLFRFLLDPRNYMQDDRTVDWVRQLQSVGAVHLLFADLMAINYSMQAHSQVTMSFLDKLANIWKSFGSSNRDEVELFKCLLSIRQAKMLRKAIRELEGVDPEMREYLCAAIGKTYAGFHRHIGRLIGQGRSIERKRLDYARCMRNFHHGAFLNRQQFEKVFVDTTGTVPEEFTGLPFFLALGLLIDPKAFVTSPTLGTSSD